MLCTHVNLAVHDDVGMDFAVRDYVSKARTKDINGNLSFFDTALLTSDDRITYNYKYQQFYDVQYQIKYTNYNNFYSEASE